MYGIIVIYTSNRGCQPLNETHLDAIKSSYDVQEILNSKKKRQGFAGVDLLNNLNSNR